MKKKLICNINGFSSKIIASVFILMVISSSPNFAYDRNIHFKHLTTDHGLSYSYVRCFFQDKQGFMWFGTFDGLNKYDGYGFTVYRNQLDNPNSLTSNVIRSICGDRQGNLWIATIQGLCLYDQERDLFVNYDWKNGFNLDSFDIWNLFQDSQGKLWIGSTGNGLYRYDPENNQSVQYSYDLDNPNSLSSNIVRQIYEDSRGNLWIGTEGGGLNLFNRDKQTFKRYLNQRKNSSSLVGNTIYAIIEDTEGYLWIACYGAGLSRIHVDHIDTPLFTNYQSNPGNRNSLSNNLILSLCADGDGGLWIGTENGGLDFLETDMKTFVHFKSNPNDPNSLSGNSIQSLFQDKNSNLWIGTYSGGANIIYKAKQTFRHFKNLPGNPNSLNNNNIWEFNEDSKENIWIATDGGGLNRFDPRTGDFKNFNSRNSNLSSDAVLTVYVDSQDNIWIGTWTGGIGLFNGEKKSFLTFTAQNSGLSNNNVFDILEDQDGYYWFATQEGLNRFNRRDNSFVVYTEDNSELISNFVEVIQLDCYGNILMGTVEGFVVFNPKNETFMNYVYDPQNKNSISNNYITSIFEEDSTTIWVSTSNGLNKIDKKTETITRYFKTDGLPNDLIFGVEKDNKGFLWISTNGGLSRFDLQTGSFKNFTKEDGLQGNTFIKKSHFKSREGNIYFGGINGFNVFDAEDITDNKTIPRIVITDFQIFNMPVRIDAEDSPLKKHISQTKEIVMSYKQSIFSFGFVAINYLSSEKNQYAYMMEGFDKKWNYVGNKREATYTNLDPGKYVFHVKGSNNDGVWNEEGTSIKLIITPPFWQTWWFRVIVAIIIGLIVTCIFELRIKNIKKQQTKLELQVQERTIDLKTANQELEVQKASIQNYAQALKKSNKELEQFAYVASHDLQEPLRIISSYITLLERKLKEKLDDEAHEFIFFITDGAQRMQTLINDLLTYSRVTSQAKPFEKMDLNILMNQVLQDLKFTIEEKQAKITHDSLPAVMCDPVQFERLFQNLIGNALKYCENKPEVHISAVQKNGKWLIGIKDNGIGIDPKYNNKIFGIFKRLHHRDEYSGTGIGLAVCKKIVERHGGEIWVESEGEGKGSTFYFTMNEI